MPVSTLSAAVVAEGEETVTPELLDGGKELRNDSLGGYVSVVGQRYSYESFLCFRTN